MICIMNLKGRSNVSSAYLYQLSSTGGYKLIGSNTNFTESYDDSGAFLGSVDISSKFEFNK